MPYKSDKHSINNPNLDRRVKLLKEQKNEILKLYNTGEYSQRKLARMYNVGRRTIQFMRNTC